MPINIYPEDNPTEQIVWLCDDEWSLPIQLDELKTWVSRNKSHLPQNRTVADIGFMVRKDAAGGGAVLTAESMKGFSESNVDIHFSEYRDE